MNTELHSIEDCLETLVGLREAPKFDIVKEDHTILSSIARQCFKGTALTDRQYALMQEKLEKYKEQFESHDYITFDIAVTNLRQPLRQIDRSKYIKLSSEPPQAWHANDQGNWIEVRFPFSKTLIVDVQSIKYDPSQYFHEKGSHTHFFYFTESHVVQIVDMFKNKNFEIDQELIEYYNKVKLFDDETTYAPGIINFKFNNVHPRAQELALQELGEPCADNIVQYKDRSTVYGIRNFDSSLDSALPNYSVLTQAIAQRNTHQVFARDTKWDLNQIVNTLIDLDRFPLVVLLSESNPTDHLTQTHQLFRNLFNSAEISVQFRLPSDRDNGFNDYIKHNGLNSPVDKNTKIVYTSMDKLNKPLLISDCNPRTALLMNSHRLNMRLDQWLSEFDLVVHHDKDISSFMRYMKNKITEV